jgi:DUF2075 family protein
MLISVEEFCDRSRSNLEGLVGDLQDRTGRYGDSEAVAWRSSLPRVAEVLSRTQLGAAHLAFHRQRGLELEYRLPASSSWTDAVLLGRGPNGPAALFLELKDWETAASVPGPRPGLLEHRGNLVLHPSEQVRGYVDYCRRFHSGVQDEEARVDGLVFLTRSTDGSALRKAPHDALVADFPVFTVSSSDLHDHLPGHIQSRIHAADERFAHAFAGGSYRQERSFVRGMSEVIRDPSRSPFVLLDYQRLGLERCMQAIEEAEKNSATRAVVIVEGPPGSGKSVLAAQLWAELVQRQQGKKGRSNAVLVTTSACQRSNWEEIFERISERRGGKGVVIPANQFNPGLTHPWRQSKLDSGYTIRAKDWRDNISLLSADGVIPKIEDRAMAVSIVDEAHALIDPSLPGTEGVSPSGWMIHAGPQAYHVMRGSRVSVFLMDSKQSYRDNETTTPEILSNLAGELGISSIVRVSLHDAQFRCGGSKEYLDWLDATLEGDVAKTTPRWTPGAGFAFTICDDPEDLEGRLRPRLNEGHTARLVTSYNRQWLTKDATNPHTLDPDQRDFVITYQRQGKTSKWTKVWNYAPGQDYSTFIQGHAGSAIAADPLCEIGCPYVVRGFDYDHLGVIWGADLLWRGKWTVDLSRVHESAWKKTLAAARKGNPEAIDRTITLLKRAYRILLSRAVRGVFVWFEDEQTRRHVESLLHRTSPASEFVN